MTSYFLTCDTQAPSGACVDNVELNTRRISDADRQNSINGRNEQKYLLYSRSVEKHENNLDDYINEKSNKSRNVNIALYNISTMNTFIDTNLELYKEWPGHSPTVNISWFIAKAYLANLYYITQRDVSLTIKTCDEVIGVYQQSYMNQQFAECIFPVVLSTQRTSIYDK